MIVDRLKEFIPVPVKARIKIGKYVWNLRKRMSELKKEEEKVSLVIGTPLHTNLGDHLITMAQFQYLKEIGYLQKVFEVPTEMYQIFSKTIRRMTNIDTVFINGGGWMGNLWIPEELLIQKLVKDFSDKKIVIFPQTIYFDNKIIPYESLISSANEIFSQCKDITLCVREQHSYDFAVHNYRNVKVILVPDIALSFYRSAPKNRYQHNKKVGLCLRKDRELYGTDEIKQYVITWFKKNGYTMEQIDTMNQERVKIEEREKVVKQRLEDFRTYDFIITDRLHGMIFSYICGTPCIIFDNKTHKVSGVYDTWLKTSKKIFPVFRYENVHGLKKFVTSDLNFNENVCTWDQFNKLKENIIYGKN